MERDLHSSHIEGNGRTTVLSGARVVSDTDLLKVGAGEIREDDVANVQLVSPALKQYILDFYSYL